MKSVWAKIFGWGQFAVAIANQVSQGHIPQNKTEWSVFLTSLLIALGTHHASGTDGTK